MRVEPYSIDSIVHITKRGARGMNIVCDLDDRWRFAKSLFLLNDSHTDPNLHRDMGKLPLYVRPAHW